MADPLDLAAPTTATPSEVCAGTTPDEQFPRAAAPVTAEERFASIDVVRGFALLGILVMNILSFGLPDAVLFNPNTAGGFSGLNYVEWLVSSLFFDHKMMTTFSMLFGAGILIFADRAAARGRSPARLFYRRAGVLLVFGLLHAYLLWEGDILFTYALAGMVAYLFRKRSPTTLFVLAVLTAVPPLVFERFSSAFFDQARAAYRRVDAARASGQSLSETDRGLAEAWSGMREMFEPTPEMIARQITLHSQGSYWQIARERAQGAFFIQAMLFPAFIGWDALGRMLIGMALMKLGVFTAARSRRFYLLMTLLGYAIGLALVGFGMYENLRHDFDVVHLFRGGTDYNEFGSLFVAFGHIGALLLIYKSGAFEAVMRRLAAVGRMAFSNYLMHTIICTTLFYGYGFGIYGKLDRVQLLGVVAAVWAFQLWLSPIWLKHFRFGPAEWLWRTLTYGKAQPMRIASSE
jgi:uncharacterized protein